MALRAEGSGALSWLRDRAWGPCILGFRVATVFAWTYQGGQQTAGLRMQIFRCNGTLSQAWELRPILPFVPNVVGLGEQNAENTLTLYDLSYAVPASIPCNSACDKPGGGGRIPATAWRERHA